MFMVGDRLRIKDTERNRSDLRESSGTEIIVTRTDDHHVWFKRSNGRETGGWLFERFELVPPDTTDTTEGANYYHAIVGYSNAERVS